MKEKVLITGASGFIGYHLILEALKNNLEVFAAIRKSSRVDHLQGLGIHFVFFDFSNPKNIQEHFETDRYDYIVHAAGITRAMTLEQYNKVNVEASVNLAKVAIQFPVKKFVFLSSLAVLGPLKYEEEIPLKENYLPCPVTNYGRSKLAAEQELKKIEKLPLIIVRPTAVYGPREKDILIMFQTLNRGLEPYIGKINQRLSFIYVKDLVGLIFRSLFSDRTNETYNLSDGGVYSRFELSDYAKKVLNKKTLKFCVPMGIVKVIARLLEATSRKKAPVLNLEKINELAAENWNCSIEKAKSHFQFQPKYDLQRGVAETINWYRKNNWL